MHIRRQSARQTVGQGERPTGHLSRTSDKARRVQGRPRRHPERLHVVARDRGDGSTVSLAATRCVHTSRDRGSASHVGQDTP